MRVPIAEAEWIGGIVSTAPLDTTADAPLVHLVQWIEGETAVGTSSVRAGALAEIVEALRLAVKAPNFGSPRTPRRVRVAVPERAEALRAAYPKIEIVCAPTPEIDRVALMVACWKKNAARGGGYLKAPITPHSIEKFFRGTSSFVRAEPWRVHPGRRLPYRGERSPLSTPWRGRSHPQGPADPYLDRERGGLPCVGESRFGLTCGRLDELTCPPS